MSTSPQRPDLAAALIERATNDRTFRTQLVRGELDDAAYGVGVLQQQANSAFLQQVLDMHGWPTRVLVGDLAVAAAWRIALHGDHSPDIQRFALSHLRTATDSDRTLLPLWAHLHDRCNVVAGQPQLHATQSRLVDGTLSALPIADPKHLDARRTAAGLPSYATARARLLQRYAALLRQDEDDDPSAEPPLAVLLATA
ncbi:DUF6624 domain-containing protein [Streptomyces sp. NPDC087440]|uniref:DUF6624 domain-containing protein n=1 Tax=Streptomyces sp. NPDC087440 TaxID=3365790 RepID=UPI003805E4A7